MTDAIEVGARANDTAYVINQHIGWIKLHAETMTADNWRDMKLYIESQIEALSEAFDKYEAAIASGALVPASAVAEMREIVRICRGAEHDAKYAEKHLDGHGMQRNVEGLAATFKFIREKLEVQLDLAPARTGGEK